MCIRDRLIRHTFEYFLVGSTDIAKKTVLIRTFLAYEKLINCTIFEMKPHALYVCMYERARTHTQNCVYLLTYVKTSLYIFFIGHLRTCLLYTSVADSSKATQTLDSISPSILARNAFITPGFFGRNSEKGYVVTDKLHI